MSREPHYVAVEGQCCAGKTTLVRGLVQNLTNMQVSRVKCYADHVGGGKFLPREVPESLAEDADGLQALITVEADRIRHARVQLADLVLMDRSVHTLLAHRYALERVTRLPCFEPAWQTLTRSTVPAWPSLVLYLDVSHEVVAERNALKFAADSILVDPAFNRVIRAYFSELANCDHPVVAWLDASQGPTRLLTEASTRIVCHLGEVGV